MSETAQENTNPAEVPPPKSKKTLIIIVLVVVLLVGGGGGGFYFWTKSTASAAEKEAETKGKSEKEDIADSEPSEDESSTDEAAGSSKDEVRNSLRNALPDDENVKHVIELQPFIINLADENEARYLRMTVSLGVGESGEEKPSELFLTRVKNAMLAVLSVKTSEDVLSIKGKNKLRKELLKAAQAASEEPLVEAIYITDFIVQL